MGMSPVRFAIAICFGLTATSVLYVSQQAVGSPVPRPLSKASSVPITVAATRSVRPEAALPLPSFPRRIVVRHAHPGDVVFTMRGEELQVEFRQAPQSTPAPRRHASRQGDTRHD